MKKSVFCVRSAVLKTAHDENPDNRVGNIPLIVATDGLNENWPISRARATGYGRTVGSEVSRTVGSISPYSGGHNQETDHSDTV